MADIDVSSLTDQATKATGLDGIVLVTPQKTKGYQPQNVPSWEINRRALPRALVFNYEGENVADLQSDITDHFIENNSAIQDQIAIKPVMYRVTGFVGELNDVAPAALTPLKIAAEKLTVIGAYVPQVSATAILAYNAAFAAYQIAQTGIDLAASAWATINGSNGTTVINGSTSGTDNGELTNQLPNQTKQQIYFQQFYAYWKRRTLFTIQTPWAIFQDMAIVSLNAVQDAETDKISTFTINFKQLRFASTVVRDQQLYDSNNFQGRLLNQGSTPVNRGTSILTPSSASFGTEFGVA